MFSNGKLQSQPHLPYTFSKTSNLFIQSNSKIKHLCVQKFQSMKDFVLESNRYSSHAHITCFTVL